MRVFIAVLPDTLNPVVVSVRRLLPGLLMLAVLLPAGASDQAPIGTRMIAYPARGQTSKQQEVEQFGCHEKAVKLSKYNPRTAYAYIDNRYGRESDGPGQQGYFGRSKRADAGGAAALGAVAGAASGVPLGGAAVGALAGTAVGNVRRAGQDRRQKKFDSKRDVARNEREHTMAQRQQVYERSWTECMQALGYTTP